jgi:hypothetical protein
MLSPKEKTPETNQRLGLMRPPLVKGGGLKKE